MYVMYISVFNSQYKYIYINNINMCLTLGTLVFYKSDS